MSLRFATDAEDEGERIGARRQRIEKRLHVLKGGEVTEGGPGDADAIAAQVERSADVLERLTLEGKEMVSSVAVAGAAREVARRSREARAAERRAAELEEEAASAADQLAAIAERWRLAEGQSDALELFELLNDQRCRCDAVTSQKQALASRLRGELAQLDVQYEETLQTQHAELALAAERVDRQVAALKQAQSAELALIQVVSDGSRGAKVISGESHWSQLWSRLQEVQLRRDSERAGLSASLASREDALHERLAERLHAARLDLQHQAEALGLQLQGLRASCLLNAEKMRLNTELLRSRDQEARVMRAAQKRRINKLQDKLRALQMEVSRKRVESGERRRCLRERVARLTAEETRAGLPQAAQMQLRMVVTHGARQAAALVRQIVNIDSVLHSEQLCVPWQSPERLEARLRALCLAICECQSLPSSSECSSEALQEASALLHSETSGLQQLMLRSLVACSAQFLSPEKTGKVHQGTLVQLAACLAALGVETESDLLSLFGVLRARVSCAACPQLPFLPAPPPECPDHRPRLEGGVVLAALRAFTASRAVQAEEEPEAVARPAVRVGVPQSADWSQFERLLPPDLGTTWDSLHEGLRQHLAVLQERHELNCQLGRMQAQNVELRRLLQSCTATRGRRNNQH